MGIVREKGETFLVQCDHNHYFFIHYFCKKLHFSLWIVNFISFFCFHAFKSGAHLNSVDGIVKKLNFLWPRAVVWNAQRRWASSEADKWSLALRRSKKQRPHLKEKRSSQLSTVRWGSQKVLFESRPVWFKGSSAGFAAVGDHAATVGVGASRRLTFISCHEHFKILNKFCLFTLDRQLPNTLQHLVSVITKKATFTSVPFSFNSTVVHCRKRNPENRKRTLMLRIKSLESLSFHAASFH